MKTKLALECSAVSLPGPITLHVICPQVSWSFSLQGWNISLERVTAVENQEMDGLPLPQTTKQISSTLYSGVPGGLAQKQRNEKPRPMRNSFHNYILVAPLPKAKDCSN